MLEKLAGIESRYDELNQMLMEVGDDYHRAAELAKEKSELEEIVNLARSYRQALARRDEARTLLESDDAELRELAEAELSDLEPEIEGLEKQIRGMLVPKDPRDARNVIMEIRAGAGGDEAAIFAADLFRMYSRYAERNRWSIEVLSSNEIGVGGLKEIIFTVKGRGAYSRLKYESGVHRVQRVPVTESQGRIHTSTATVAVLAEVDEVEVQIPENDIVVDVFKSAGAGGQNVQKNATAVRITHIPTGIVVACQDERSQLQNRATAMKILRARLTELKLREREKEKAELKGEVPVEGWGNRIRSYVLQPYTMVTDHRTDYSTGNVAAVLDGDLDPLVDAYLHHTMGSNGSSDGSA